MCLNVNDPTLMNTYNVPLEDLRKVLKLDCPARQWNPSVWSLPFLAWKPRIALRTRGVNLIVLKTVVLDH